MRVITGEARGRRLATLEGEAVRPTPERVKEALFSILQFRIEGRRVLDLFAGSGQLGIEALSRGAREVVFVDFSRQSIAVAEQNLASTGLLPRAKLVNRDFSAFLAQEQGRFDLALLDPPYRTGLLQQALPLVAQAMNQGGTIVCEHPDDEKLPEAAGDFVRGKSYRHGKVMLTIYQNEAAI